MSGDRKPLVLAHPLNLIAGSPLSNPCLAQFSLTRRQPMDPDHVRYQCQMAPVFSWLEWWRYLKQTENIAINAPLDLRKLPFQSSPGTLQTSPGFLIS